ncbi:helix-turn-helix domain-containing protein [Kribbella sp. NPDC058245]|uniref:helix-turn-helix domain-containing protein n=1 Tax=Kribbella sp. NPDC058245 TaxID=3346399 RepID=UPI0036F1160C
MRTLEPWLDGISRADEPVTVLPPDPATTLLWRVTPAGVSDVLVIGPRTKASYPVPKFLPVCVRLRVRPGRATALLGVAADELTDQVIPLAELTGPSADRLGERLGLLRDQPQRGIDVLGDYLLERLPEHLPTRYELVGAAVQELAGGTSTSDTADRLGVSERYLRRVFRQAVGVSPKHFARISRVRDVIGRQRSSWSVTAAETGYADQSHLIADFRSLMGVTPAAFAAGRVPVTAC